MGKITLVTGSGKSGKSRWAVSYFDCCDNIQYLCTTEKLDKRTMERIIYNESSHNVCWDLRRNFRFETPPPDLLEYDNFIIDSVSDLVWQEICLDFKNLELIEESDINEMCERFTRQITDFVKKIKFRGGNVVIITDEVGFTPNHFGGNPWLFQNALCIVNQRLAALADEVYFSVSGIQLKI